MYVNMLVKILKYILILIDWWKGSFKTERKRASVRGEKKSNQSKV